MKFTSSQPSQTHCNSTIIYFNQREQSLTQFVKVLPLKLSDMLHSSNFVRLFHCQSFVLYGTDKVTEYLVDHCLYHIFLNNTTFSISTPVQYYLNTNNIDIVVIFISSAPSNSTTCHFATPGIMANYRVMMIISLIVF